MFKSKTADPQKELEEMRNASTLIGKGSTVEGTIEAFGNIRIEGTVKGDVRSKSKVVLSDSAKLEGTILSQNAEIAGEIKGKVEVSDLLVLKSTAVVHGDIVTNKLVVEAGATFDGSCKMGAIIKEINIGSAEKQPELIRAKEKTA